MHQIPIDSVGYKRKRSANVAEVGPGKKARACEDDSESERQVRGPSPTGMDSLTGPEPSCSRVDAGAAPAPTQARARADDSESERQLRVPSPTGMDARAGLELNCNRAGANAALVLTQAQQPKQQRPPQRQQQQQRKKKKGEARKQDKRKRTGR